MAPMQYDPTAAWPQYNMASKRSGATALSPHSRIAPKQCDTETWPLCDMALQPLSPTAVLPHRGIHSQKHGPTAIWLWKFESTEGIFTCREFVPVDATIRVCIYLHEEPCNLILCHGAISIDDRSKCVHKLPMSITNPDKKTHSHTTPHHDLEPISMFDRHE